jgi:hypothetical protein
MKNTEVQRENREDDDIKTDPAIDRVHSATPRAS